MTILRAYISCISKKSDPSATALITSLTSYGSVGSPGTIFSISYLLSGGTESITLAFTSLLRGMNDTSFLIWLKHSSSVMAKKWALPDTSQCTLAPPSSSIEISEPTTVLITSGPVMNILEIFSTTNTKSAVSYTHLRAHETGR